MPGAGGGDTFRGRLFVPVAGVCAQLTDIKTHYRRRRYPRRQFGAAFLAFAVIPEIVGITVQTFNRFFLGRFTAPAIGVTGPAHDNPSHDPLLHVRAAHPANATATKTAYPLLLPHRCPTSYNSQEPVHSASTSDRLYFVCFILRYRGSTLLTFSGRGCTELLCHTSLCHSSGQVSEPTD